MFTYYLPSKITSMLKCLGFLVTISVLGELGKQIVIKAYLIEEYCSLQSIYSKYRFKDSKYSQYKFKVYLSLLDGPRLL